MALTGLLFTLTLLTCIGDLAAQGLLVVTGYLGDDVTVLWPLDPPVLSQAGIWLEIHSSRVSTNCYSLITEHDCFNHGRHISVMTRPSNVTLMGSVNVTAVGFTLTNTTVSDADRYWLSDYHYFFFHGEAVVYIFQQPDRPTVEYVGDHRLGRNITVECNTTSTSQPTSYNHLFDMKYSWTVVNLGVPYTEYNSTILIVNARKEDTGALISCRAQEENSTLVSDESVPLRLDVHYLNFPDGLEEQTVKAGSTVSRACSASCNPPCDFRWLDDAGRLLTTRKHLVLNNVREAMTYFCQATNDIGILRKSFTLNVVYTPVIMEFQVIPQAVYQGNTTTILCVADNATGMELYSGLTRLPGNNIKGRIQHTWPEADCSLNNKDYECKATNDAGTVSQTLTMDVKCPPTINVNGTKTSFNVEVNTDVTFTADVVANPMPRETDVSLHHLSNSGLQSTLQKDSYATSINGSVVTVNFEMKEERYGQYTMSIRNHFGHAVVLFDVNPPQKNEVNMVTLGISVVLGSVVVAGVVLGTLWFIHRKKMSHERSSEEVTERPSYQNNAYVETTIIHVERTGNPTTTNYDSLGLDRVVPNTESSYETLSSPHSTSPEDEAVMYEDVRT